MLSFVTVDFNREAFFLPVLNTPIYWYGVLFALGFYLSTQFLTVLLSSKMDKKEAEKLTQNLTIYILFGLVLGARIGHVAFYEGIDKLFDLKFLLSIRDGGLASHGATLFILAAFFIWIQKRREQLKLLKIHPRTILDFVCMATLICAVCIRVGNFINQEILGTVSNLPWSVIFLNPLSNLSEVPRHPVQLYEATFYAGQFLTFSILYFKTKWAKIPGVMTGSFFIVLFAFRVFIESFKESQSIYDGSVFQMGQMLSIPMILFGVLYLSYSIRTYSNTKEKDTLSL
jgi:prolipoprotein diacylglyceryl transferase